MEKSYKKNFMALSDRIESFRRILHPAEEREKIRHVFSN